MSHEPLRPEPGPRDWSPPGWDLPPGREVPTRRRGGFRRSSKDGAFTVLLLGIVAVLAATVSVASSGGTAVLLSSIGVFAVIAGVAVLWRARSGVATLSRGRHVVALTGTTFGAIALASTIATAINVTANTTLPTLHDAVATLLAPAASPPPSATEPLEVAETSITSADAELLYLLEVLERVKTLVIENETTSAELRFVESTAPLPHRTPDGAIGIGSIEHFAPTLQRLADGSLELTVVGHRYGTTLTIPLTSSPADGT